MATTAWKVRYKKKLELVAKYAETRRKLKDEKNYVALAKLPRNSSPTRFRNRCEVTGRPRAYYRKLKMSRISLRDLGSNGLVPGLVKSSW